MASITILSNFNANLLPFSCGWQVHKANFNISCCDKSVKIGILPIDLQ